MQCATGLEKLSIAVVMARVDVGPAMALVTLHSAPLGHQRIFAAYCESGQLADNSLADTICQMGSHRRRGLIW